MRVNEGLPNAKGDLPNEWTQDFFWEENLPGRNFDTKFPTADANELQLPDENFSQRKE